MSTDLAGAPYLLAVRPPAWLEDALDQLTWITWFILALFVGAGVSAWIVMYFIKWFAGMGPGPFPTGELALRDWGALYRSPRGSSVAHVLPADADENLFYGILKHLMWRTGPFRLMVPVLAGTAFAVGGWLLLGTEQTVPGVLVVVFGAALLAVRGFNDVQLKPPAGMVRRIVVRKANNTSGDNALADLVATFDAATGQVIEGQISEDDWRRLREAMWQLAGHDHPSRSDVTALTGQVRAAAGSV